jgi:rhombotail lipoprotein
LVSNFLKGVILKYSRIYFLPVLAIALFASCASWLPQGQTKQMGSMVDYLYPNAKEAPTMQQSVTHLRPPIRVGIAFVPSASGGNIPSEADKIKLLQRVKSAFGQYEFIGNIEVIPSQYLQPRGGFTNLNQVARMFNVELVALLSYDQVQFNDTNALSVLYWTIIGAYVIHGDQYDIQTLLDASIFDVASQKLLFRAPGTSQIKGSASMSGFSESSREARLEGFNKAVDNLIPQLQASLADFKQRIKQDASVRIENKAGYNGGGDVGWLGALIALLLLGSYRVVRPRAL